MCGMSVREVRGRASLTPFIDRVIDSGPDTVTAPDDALSVRDYLDLMLAGSFPEPSLRIPAAAQQPSCLPRQRPNRRRTCIHTLVTARRALGSCQLPARTYRAAGATPIMNVTPENSSTGVDRGRAIAPHESLVVDICRACRVEHIHLDGLLIAVPSSRSQSAQALTDRASRVSGQY